MKYKPEEIFQNVAPLLAAVPYRCFLKGTTALDTYLAKKAKELSMGDDVILQWEVNFGTDCCLVIHPDEKRVLVTWGSTQRTTLEASVAVSLYSAVVEWAAMVELIVQKVFAK